MSRSIHKRALLATLTLLISGLALAGPASATLPGKNGPLLFNSFFGFSSKAPRTFVSAGTGNGKFKRVFARKGLVGMPTVSPDGKRMIFQALPANDLYTVVLSRPGKALRIASTQKNTLSSQGVFAADGKSVYYTVTTATTGGTYRNVLKQYFFATRKTKSREIRNSGEQALVLNDVSPNGRLAALSEMLAPVPKTVIMNVTTGGQRVLDKSMATIQASFSPDGKRLAYAGYKDPSWDIFTAKVNGQGVRRLTKDKTSEYYPYFSPDGKKIAFTRTAGSKPKDVGIITLKSGRIQRLKTPAPYTFVTQWLPR